MDARVLDVDLAAGRRLMARLEAFADFTDEPRRLTRLFLSEAHRRAALAFIGWCSEARLDEPKAPQEVVDIVQLRCMMCHAAQPMEEIGEAPKGVLLDTPEHIARFGPAIRQQAVLSHAMPPNNFSQMTDDERRTLARWLGVETAQN